jgi:hypothetical protein
MVYLRALCTGLLFLSPTVAARGEDAQSKSAQSPGVAQANPEILYVRLALPDRPPLDDRQIRTTLAEHKLVLDDKYSPAPNIKIRTAMLGGCPPKESFFGDGRWERTVCGLTYQTHRGSWAVRDSRVCVRQENVAEECRRVWSTASLGRVILSVPIAPNEFNPYLLTPLTADH